MFVILTWWVWQNLENHLKLDLKKQIEGSFGQSNSESWNKIQLKYLENVPVVSISFNVCFLFSMKSIILLWKHLTEDVFFSFIGSPFTFSCC